MAPLNEGTLVDAIMSARGQVDFLWQFFVTVHIALFALLFVYDHAVEGLNWIARIFAMLGIAAFEWINGNALIGSYLLLDSMHEQYRMSFGQPDRFQSGFYETFVLSRYDTRPEMVLMTHSAALVVILIAVFSRRYMQTSQAKKTLAAKMAEGSYPE